MHDQNQHFLASIRNPCLQVICFSMLNWVLLAISKDLHAYMALFKHCLHMIYKGNGTQLHLQQNCLYSYSYKHMRELTSRFNPIFFPAVHWPEYQSNWEPFAFCFAQRQHSWQHSIKPKCVTHRSIEEIYRWHVLTHQGVKNQVSSKKSKRNPKWFFLEWFFWHWLWVRWKMVKRQQKTAFSPVLGKPWPKLQTLACSCSHNELFWVASSSYRVLRAP